MTQTATAHIPVGRVRRSVTDQAAIVSHPIMSARRGGDTTKTIRLTGTHPSRIIPLPTHANLPPVL